MRDARSVSTLVTPGKRDLARGVDADLVRENRGRFNRDLAFLGGAFLLNFLVAKFQLPHSVRLVLGVVCLILFWRGLITLIWAKEEKRSCANRIPRSL